MGSHDTTAFRLTDAQLRLIGRALNAELDLWRDADLDGPVGRLVRRRIEELDDLVQLLGVQ